MCGIIAGIAKRSIVDLLLEGLSHLEYRGYDSAGLVVLDAQMQLKRVRAQGKVNVLREQLSKDPLKGCLGIAHTRWATHGEPCERNAHPQMSYDQIAVVHNGIIENHAVLRAELVQQGYEFDSETDTEVIAHLFHDAVKQTMDLCLAARQVVARLQGAFALGLVSATDPTRLIAVREGSPLCIGIGYGEHYLASDHLALASMAQSYFYLLDGDIAEITLDGVQVFDAEHQLVTRSHKALTQQHVVHDKGRYQHFMLKEIHEQPQAISDTLEGRLGQNQVLVESFGPKALAIFSKVRQVHIVACGTSYYAGQVAEYWLEQLAGVPCKVQIASEYRYRPPVMVENTLFVALSQSGETADTLAAVRLAKTRGYLSCVGICNVADSSLVREVDLPFLIHAGPEIGVASTKALTSQLVAQLLLTVSLQNCQGTQTTFDLQPLRDISRQIQQILSLSPAIKDMASQLLDKQHALFLGRGVFYPIAEEGALKLKEISYIHAEAYPAGELKHGPLALIDKQMPVIVLLPNDDSLPKLRSNLQEVRARGGQLFVFAEETADLPDAKEMTVLRLPEVNVVTAPIVYVVALQLLAYHVAVLKGTDVDQPRNLAKSVTVE